MKKNLILTILALLIACTSYADTLTTQDVYELNNATPGTSKVGLGTRLEGMFVSDGSTVAASASVSQSLTASYAAYAYTSSASVGNAYVLANGSENQEVTFVLVTDGGKDIIITPTTRTGFTNITLNDAKDSATLKYIDSTIGWVVKGNNAATIN